MKRLLIACMVLAIVLPPIAISASGGSDHGSSEQAVSPSQSGGVHKGGEAHGGLKEKLVALGWKAVNVVILVILLWKFAAGGVKGFFNGRRDSIAASLDHAEEARLEARKNYDEYTARLTAATKEIEDLVDAVKSQGRTEKEKIIEETLKVAEKMKIDARLRLEKEAQGAIFELKTEAAELSVQIARDIVLKNMTKSDHERMIDDFLKKAVRQN
ncbi:MAG: F0F1 ATP synthase subunit B [Deltaproteobacteria bacterium]|nr:F0F1 ATP synthase subunit B [Deltaproteobacteria bacterium]